MCERFSWIERDGDVLFLTSYDVFDTRRGKQLRKHTPSKEDWYGHGAIRWFYDLGGGTERECTDFSSPKNFPPALVEAIKDGEMWEFGITNEMLVMLTRQSRAKYEKVCAPARAKRNEVCASAMAECNEVCASAWAKYYTVRQQAFIKLFREKTNRIKAWR